MNRPSYFEIHVDDLDRAQEFYSEVFGWTFQKWENKAAGATDYYAIKTGEGLPGLDGGLFKRMGPPPADMQAVNAFVITMNVENIDQTISKIEKAGGKVALPKFAMPGMAWIAYYKDTEGNIFGIYQEDKTAK
jgi:predicted enzyme related to lactoylglutathione lyase